jgi:hypothetical protein
MYGEGRFLIIEETGAGEGWTQPQMLQMRIVAETTYRRADRLAQEISAYEGWTPVRKNLPEFGGEDEARPV